MNLMKSICCLGVAPVVLLAGCYRYVPADLSAVQPGREVRVRVSETESNRFAAVLTPGVRVLEGEVVELTGQSVLLQVPVAAMDQGSRIETLSQRLDVSRSGILDVELRQIDKTKTGLLVGGAIAIGGFILVKSLSGAFSSDEEDGGTPGTDILVPIFLRLRW
jgi:hypothetical protein